MWTKRFVHITRLTKIRRKSFYSLSFELIADIDCSTAALIAEENILDTPDQHNSNANLIPETVNREFVQSPDLFTDGEDDDEYGFGAGITENDQSLDSRAVDCLLKSKEEAECKRIKNLLHGASFSSSNAHCQLDVTAMLNLYNSNSAIYGYGAVNLVPYKSNKHPKNSLTYDVHYNRTKYSENIEAMNMELAIRYINHETSSSFSYNPIPETGKMYVLK